jgi:hypothetical protein
MNATFKQARVSPQAGHFWIINELIDRRDPLAEVHATVGAKLSGVTRQAFQQAVAKADQFLRRAGLTERARSVVGAHADIWPLTDADYTAMVGPNGPRGRSVSDFAVANPSAVYAEHEKARRGTRAFNPGRLKKSHENT